MQATNNSAMMEMWQWWWSHNNNNNNNNNSTSMQVDEMIRGQRELHVDDPVAEFANCCGQIALWSYSFFLIAVARRSYPLVVVSAAAARTSSQEKSDGSNYYNAGIQWPGAAAAAAAWIQRDAVQKFHVWPGRVVVLASGIHGVVHMYRWKYLLDLRLLHDRILPSAACYNISWQLLGTSDRWQQQQQQLPEDCLEDITGCSCYDIFRNLVGFLALTGMLFIGITSLYKIRRRFFRLFYLSHIIAAPLVTLFMCLHFTRTIVYIAPSVLYYAACSFPVLLETARNKLSYYYHHPHHALQSHPGVRILSCERIISTAEEGECDDPIASAAIRPCVSFVVEASDEAMKQYKPGQHVLVNVPALSIMSHPFTVNRVLSSDDGLDSQQYEQEPLLRLTFRETGDFTRQLGRTLCSYCCDGGSSSSSGTSGDCRPVLYMNGFYGSTRRVQDALQHDVVVMIAGGIGIVAYLSVLDELINRMTASKLKFESQGSGAIKVRTKKIALHWICRESSLIQFMQREYLDPLRNKAAAAANHGIAFSTTIYYTGDGVLSAETSSSTRSSSAKPSDLDSSTLDYDGELNEHHGTLTTTRGSLADPVGEPFTPSNFASIRSNESVGRYEKVFVYGVMNCCLGPWISWYACSNALKEEDVAATVWSWICVLSIGVSAALSARTMDTRSFAAFSSMMWSGLFVIWFVYLNVHDENARLGARLISPVAVSFIAVSVSVLYNYQSKSTRVEYKPLAVDRSDGTEMTLVETGLVRQLCDGGGGDGNLNVVRKDNETGSASSSLVVGRPSVQEILASSEGTDDVGIFSCGPAGLMQDIRCNVRRRNCLAGSSCIPIYEESFET